MSLPLDITQVFYNADSRRWHWGAGSGRTGFVAESAIRAELDSQQAALKGTLQELARQAVAGEISVADFERAFAAEVKAASIAQAIFGNGGLANMTPSAWGRVGQQLREQYTRLHENFATKIADGTMTEGQALVRAGMYADAVEQGYWDAVRAELASGEMSEYVKSLPVLRQSPRDGGTQCLTNCRCEIRPNEDGSVDWIDNEDAAECPDCAALGNGGPYRPG